MKRQDTSPASPPGVTPQQAAESAEPSQGAESAPSPRARRLRILIVVLSVPLLLCLGYSVLSLVAFPDAAQVVELKGVVQMRGPRDTLWHPVQVKQLVRAKDWMRTAQGAGARVRFFDVSTADLEEETEITIEQLGQRRQRRGGDVAVKVWSGEMAVRAVRLLDPASSVRVDTPTASTVVRGARFSVQVGEDGETQLDLLEGSADVQIGDEVVSLSMGERITTDAGGDYRRERVFEPNFQLVFDRVIAAWDAPGETFRLDLPEHEVNQLLAATSGEYVPAVRDAQIWFTDGQARFAATLIDPITVDLSASIEARVVDGRLEPQIRLNAAGIGLPLPTGLLDQAFQVVTGEALGLLDQAQAYVEFSEVRIEDGRLLVVGRKIDS
jgi:hypothetical protein